jgi:hypothetical protein
MSVTSAIHRMVSRGFTLERAVDAAEICEEEMSNSIATTGEKRRAWDAYRERQIAAGRKGAMLIRRAPVGGAQ